MKIYIENLRQCKRELAKVYNDYKTGNINSDNAKTKVYILRAIIEANFKYEIENRIEQLEKGNGGASDFYKKFIDEIHPETKTDCKPNEKQN